MRILLSVLTLTLVASAATLCAGEQFARSMAGQFAITSSEGWPGKRYIEGGVVFAEEFDTNNDGQIDLWRFYRRGALSSEEQDLNHDGRVDLVTRWDPKDPRVQRLVGLSRDSRNRGSNDLEMDMEGSRRWRISVDRNGDGVADRVLLADGPREFFEQLGLDLSLHPDIINEVPDEYWVEYEADDAFLGYITDYRRFARGRQSHWGEWDGRKVVWRRMGDRATTPPPQQQASTWRAEPVPGPASAPGLVATEPAAVSDPGYVSEPYVAGDPFAAQPSDSGYYYDSGPDPAFTATPVPPMSDRTRYEGLPPGESAARSLPARMRPPGVGRRQ